MKNIQMLLAFVFNPLACNSFAKNITTTNPPNSVLEKRLKNAQLTQQKLGNGTVFQYARSQISLIRLRYSGLQKNVFNKSNMPKLGRFKQPAMDLLNTT